jgi:hypothetical protein
MRKSPPHLGVGRVIPLYFHTPVNEPSEQPKECEDTKIPVKKRGTFERKTQQCLALHSACGCSILVGILRGKKRREEKKLGTAQKNPLSALNFLFGEFKAGPKI